MAIDPPGRQALEPHSPVIRWLLDSDQSIRWQVIRDLIAAPADQVAAERARVTTDGWWGGAALATLRRG